MEAQKLINKFNVSVGRVRGITDDASCYAVLEVEGKTSETRNLGGASKAFNESFSYILVSPKPTLVLTLWETAEDTEKFRGYYSCNIKDQTDDQWVFKTLGPQPPKQGDAIGELHLIVEYMTLQNALAKLEAEKQNLLAKEQFSAAEKIKKKIQKLKESTGYKTTLKVTLASIKGFTGAGDYSAQLVMGPKKIFKTATKKAGDWYEEFDFELDKLPKQAVVSVWNRKTLLGEVTFNIPEPGQRLDKWLPVCPPTVVERVEGMEIELRMQYMQEIILPEATYTPLLDMLVTNGYPLVSALALAKGVACNDAIPAIVRYFSQCGQILPMLKTALWRELHRGPEVTPENLFVPGSISLKLVDNFFSIVGKEYRAQILKDAIEDIINGDKQYELDPAHGGQEDDRPTRVANTLYDTEIVMQTLTATAHLVPMPIRDICTFLRTEVRALFPKHPTLMYTAPGDVFFTRFLCPALSAPHMNDLYPDAPTDRASKGLIVVSKCLQRLGTLSEFGAKEAHLMDLNAFVRNNTQPLRAFIDAVVSVDTSQLTYSAPPQSQIERSADLGQIHKALHRNLDRLKEYLCSPAVNAAALHTKLSFISTELTKVAERAKAM